MDYNKKSILGIAMIAAVIGFSTIGTQAYAETDKMVIIHNDVISSLSGCSVSYWLADGTGYAKSATTTDGYVVLQIPSNVVSAEAECHLITGQFVASNVDLDSNVPHVNLFFG